MRLVQYDNGGQIGVGVEVGEQVFFTGYADMLSFIRDGDRALDRANEAAQGHGRPVAFDRLEAPITNPGKIFGSGPNYLLHEKEAPSSTSADEPQWDFIKLTSAITGPYDDIVIPPADDVIKRGPGSAAPHAAEHGFAVDWEVELAVVIARTAKNVRREDAFSYVFGYTIVDDVSARSIQFHFNQRDLGKNFDTFAPMGPRIVTVDELPDIKGVRLESFVNEEQKQNVLVSEQMNPPDVAIEWLSSIIRLDPGDVLMTGTPAGIGAFADPVQFLKPGDVVRCTASGIGHIENRVVRGSTRTFPIGEVVGARLG